MPDNPSETLPVTVSAEVPTVAPFEGDVMLTVGGVLSTLTETEILALIPALFTAVPVTV